MDFLAEFGVSDPGPSDGSSVPAGEGTINPVQRSDHWALSESFSATSIIGYG